MFPAWKAILGGSVHTINWPATSSRSVADRFLSYHLKMLCRWSHQFRDFTVLLPRKPAEYVITALRMHDMRPILLVLIFEERLLDLR